MEFKLFFIAVICGLYNGAGSSDITIKPTEITVLPGDNVTILCSVEHNFDDCWVRVPGFTNRIHVKENMTLKGIEHFKDATPKECVFTVIKVTEANNGIITCFISNEDNGEESNISMNLLVLRAPKWHVFSTILRSSYKENYELIVECTIADSYPAAEIEWYLDNDKVMVGLEPVKTKNGSDFGSKTVSQTLNITLTAENNGRALKCVAHHKALKGNYSSIETRLNITFAPRALKSPENLYGVNTEEQIIISVTVIANPKPEFEWSYNNTLINKEQIGYSTDISKMDKDTYNISLNITSVKEEDFFNDFHLNISNSEGSQYYTIKISNKEAPQDIGFVVGIFISILLILIIIATVIYAKTTKRFCFNYEHLKSYYTNKSTNSGRCTAVGFSTENNKVVFVQNAKPEGVQERNENIALTAEPIYSNYQIKKNKNKVAKSELENTSNPELIYAELSLKPPEHQCQQNNQPDSTEYAQIMFTKQTNRTKAVLKK